MCGVYIHFPFCSKKCIYCNYYSTPSLFLKDKYINALKEEISQNVDYLPSKDIATLYFGGGTPSLLTISEIDFILNSLSEKFNFSEDIEITFEVNPEHLTLNYLKEIKTLGVNRLSIGVQSFQDNVLQYLGRTHNSKEAHLAISNALKANFENISIDLMYGVTKREEKQWEQDLSTAFTYPITHFSAYALTVEENTSLEKKIKEGKTTEANDKQFVDEFKMLIEKSSNVFFDQYEISNFAKNNNYSKHNSSYWSLKPYLGLGPSAHSYDKKSRKWNIDNCQKYIENITQNIPYSTTETLSDSDHFNEYIFLQIRTSKGLNRANIATLFGEDKLNYINYQFQKIDPKLYIIEDNHFILTNPGKLVSDHITTELFWIDS